MRYLLAIITLLIVNCSKLKVNDQNFQAPELLPFILDFEREFGVIIDFPVTIGKIEPKFAGLCYKWSSGAKKITIAKDIYERHKSDYYAIQQLVYHELGHCALYLDHLDSIDNNGYPLSIMYKSFFGFIQYYKDHNNSYIDQMKVMSNRYTGEYKLDREIYACEYNH